MLVYLIHRLIRRRQGIGAVFGLFGATFAVARQLHLDVRWVVIIVINLAFVPRAGDQLAGAHRRMVTGALVAATYVYAPERRNFDQATVTMRSSSENRLYTVVAQH